MRQRGVGGNVDPTVDHDLAIDDPPLVAVHPLLDLLRKAWSEPGRW
jgi:hypothetical protein